MENKFRIAYPSLLSTLCALASSGIYLTLFTGPTRLGSADADRWYHLAVAKIYADHGIPSTLPQVEDLGWGNFFPDKEFFLHWLSGFSYLAGGEAGVLALVPFFAALIGLTLYFCLKKRMTYAGALAWASIGILLSSPFFYRLFLLRALLISIFSWLLLLSSLLSKNRWLAFISCVFFALSYHAVYLPLALMGVASLTLFSSFKKSAPFWLSTLSGLCLGILVHPYFPSNVWMGWVHLKIALHLNPKTIAIADEALSLSWLEFFKQCLSPMVIFVTALTLFRAGSHEPREDKSVSREFQFLLLLATGLLIGSKLSPRLLEYLFPVSVILGGYTYCLLSHFKSSISSKIPVKPSVAFVLLLLVIQIPLSYVYMKTVLGQVKWIGDAHFRALSSLPSNLKSPKIYTCQWDSGPYILYAHPEARFVDILEPALLWEKSPDLYRLRENLNRGLIHSPEDALRKVFLADFVLCGSHPLTHQMEADPKHFKRLTPFPSSQETAVVLYEVVHPY